ncbi:hypothetical protein P175DRAFT_0505613 [Aspergillus ochraceoroseus IBT 24754]|uniref:Uncharacterized protein n=3 Tax=Aspergillus subgen. Nidulantes TaxID=2720870 RepID=A0A2T5M5L3_9EURO|nr:uncharacterized protein P175DRAFT_0505613 [Aspergillus ochraceoroseus IBT 24754]KKK24560.1 hypothetical protein AOCH_000411 [Aspergillus ochraceoroseus]PTU23825.1 hypothetical protein P175DRAFT_0505613 [Aspergillus ochraceoroseus IBT 24754]
MRRRPIRGHPPPENQQPDNPEQAEQQFYPGIYDVLKVRHILAWKVIAGGVPAEVVDMIIDAAEYWPSVEFRMEGQRIIRKDVDQALVRTSPLCYDERTLDTPSPKQLPHRAAHPCRKVIFSIVSHDQGGASQARMPNPYDGSYTWFDVEVIHNAQDPSQREVIEAKMNPVERVPRHFGPDDPLLLPREHNLQSNRARVQPAHLHKITWHYLDDIEADSPEAAEIERIQGRGRATLDGNQVRGLQIGDSIMVWGRARFPGWTNYTVELSVRVFWAV